MVSFLNFVFLGIFTYTIAHTKEKPQMVDDQMSEKKKERIINNYIIFYMKMCNTISAHEIRSFSLLKYSLNFFFLPADRSVGWLVGWSDSRSLIFISYYDVVCS